MTRLLLGFAFACLLLAPGAAHAQAKTQPQKTPPPPAKAPAEVHCNSNGAMWKSIAHPGWGEMSNSGKGFKEGMPKKKFYLGFIPFFGWPGYLQVVSAIDAKNCKTNDWNE
jgi:hypothetical protein